MIFKPYQTGSLFPFRMPQWAYLQHGLCLQRALHACAFTYDEVCMERFPHARKDVFGTRKKQFETWKASYGFRWCAIPGKTGYSWDRISEYRRWMEWGAGIEWELQRADHKGPNEFVRIEFRYRNQLALYRKDTSWTTVLTGELWIMRTTASFLCKKKW